MWRVRERGNENQMTVNRRVEGESEHTLLEVSKIEIEIQMEIQIEIQIEIELKR